MKQLSKREQIIDILMFELRITRESAEEVANRIMYELNILEEI